MADANKINQIETKNILKVGSVEGKNIAKMGNTPVKFAAIPEGLIIMYNDTSIPDGFERFTLADDRYIVGAGNSYSAGATGGSTFNYSQGSSTTGNHTGTLYTNVFSPTNNYEPLYGGQYDSADPYSAGAHNHTVTANYDVNAQTLILIKALEAQGNAPANAIFLAVSQLTGLTNVYGNGRCLRSGSSIAQTGGLTNELCSQDGNHVHSTSHQPLSSGSSYIQSGLITGNHDHTLSLSMTSNVKRKLLSAWSAVSQFDMQIGMIGMWEGTTAPDDWQFCDGSNGTPDLRDYFIEMVGSGSENVTGTGNNTISGSYTLASSSWTHDHRRQRYPWASPPRNFYHASESISHSHSKSFSNNAYTPPYYALSFVMKAA